MSAGTARIPYVYRSDSPDKFASPGVVHKPNMVQPRAESLDNRIGNLHIVAVPQPSRIRYIHLDKYIRTKRLMKLQESTAGQYDTPLRIALQQIKRIKTQPNVFLRIVSLQSWCIFVAKWKSAHVECEWRWYWYWVVLDWSQGVVKSYYLLLLSEGHLLGR